MKDQDAPSSTDYAREWFEAYITDVLAGISRDLGTSHGSYYAGFYETLIKEGIAPSVAGQMLCDHVKRTTATPHHLDKLAGAIAATHTKLKPKSGFDLEAALVEAAKQARADAVEAEMTKRAKAAEAKRQGGSKGEDYGCVNDDAPGW